MKLTKREQKIKDILINDGWIENQFGVISANMPDDSGSCNMVYVVDGIVEKMADQNAFALAVAVSNFMVAFDRYMASSTQGRLKEMNAARIPLNAELAKWDIEYKPVRDGITGRLF